MKWLRRILIIFLFFGSTISVNASVKVYASSYILMEASSGRVLAGENINTRYLTASICKIMTAIIAIENSNIDGYVLITEDVCNQVGSSVYLQLNDYVLVRDALYGLMLRSGNDCAYLLAKYTSGTVNDFVLMMNKYARKIGMSSSTFSNPSGLDEVNENYSSAYDMGLLMIYAMKNKVFREIVSSNKHIFTTSDGNSYCLYNKHKLVNSYDYIIGGKTGYTVKAKRTLVSYASKNGMELVCVTFNCSDDWNAHLNLFNEGFNNYEMKVIMKKQIIATKKDYLITPYLDSNIVLPLRKDEEVDINIYLLNVPIVNEKIGKICISIDNVEIYERYLCWYYE